jgi:hypothetical protein
MCIYVDKVSKYYSPYYFNREVLEDKNILGIIRDLCSLDQGIFNLYED